MLVTGRQYVMRSVPLCVQCLWLSPQSLEGGDTEERARGAAALGTWALPGLRHAGMASGVTATENACADNTSAPAQRKLGHVQP